MNHIKIYRDTSILLSLILLGISLSLIIFYDKDANFFLIGATFLLITNVFTLVKLNSPLNKKQIKKITELIKGYYSMISISLIMFIFAGIGFFICHETECIAPLSIGIGGLIILIISLLVIKINIILITIKK